MNITHLTAKLTAQRKRLGALELAAFVTGFVLMGFELVASRMLAPAIGSSTYVWTSVIGVIIGALSVGYAVGGNIADKRVRHTDIAFLLLGIALLMLMTVFWSQSVLYAIRDIFDDARIRGLLASLLLFAPTSFGLGVISPYLVRLHTLALAHTGRSVASLSALNAIGGIVGTFSVGFFFFGYVGSIQTVAFLCILLVAMSWAIVPRRDYKMRGLVTAALFLFGLLVYMPASSAQSIDIDTSSGHYKVIDATRNGQPIRYLTYGAQGVQSAVYLDNPDELALNYTKDMANSLSQVTSKDRILILGGGAYTLPEHIARQYPNSQVDVVEIDPKLKDISEQYFFYDPPKNIHHIAADARAYLNTNTTKYNVIIVDVFSEISVPFTLTTTEYTERLEKSIQPNGIILVNAILGSGPKCNNFTGGVHASYLDNFQYTRGFSANDWQNGKRQNIVLAYSNQPLDWLRSPYPEITKQLPVGKILSDNLAPVERLEFSCN